MADNVVSRVAAIEAVLVRVENNSDKRHEQNQARAASIEGRVAKIEESVIWIKGAAWSFGFLLTGLEIYRIVSGK